MIIQQLKDRVENLCTADQEQHVKPMLIGNYRKGLTLYGMNPDTGEVYLIEMTENEARVFNPAESDLAQSSSAYTAEINPTHWHVWALNPKNAARKLIQKIEQ